METVADDPLAAVHYGDEPALLLFAGSDAARERARRTAEAAGCRVTASDVPIAAAPDRLDQQIGADGVLVEVEADAPGLDALLDRIELHARIGRLRSVVIAPENMIDQVAARVWHPDVAHLCGAGEAERIEAVVRAVAPRRPVLRDIGKAEGALLQHMSQEMERMATILANLSEGESALAPAPAAGGADEAELDPGYLRAIIRARRLRDEYFKPGLFADPAFDMLLDLMVARLERRHVAVSSLCIAAAVPATTALRWIKMLTDHGLLVRGPDPQDGRRVHIQLSDDAARQLAAYLTAAQRLAPAVI